MNSFTTFSSIPYVRPDIGVYIRRTSALLRSIASGKDYEKAREAFGQLLTLSDELNTALAVVTIRNSLDTADPRWEAETDFFNGVAGRLMVQSGKIARVLISCPHRARLEEEFGGHYFRLLTADDSVSGRAAARPTVCENRLKTEYQKTVSGATALFRGERCNFSALAAHMYSADRDERREAAAAWSELYRSVSGKLDSIFDRLLAARRRIARRLGFDRYISLAYAANHHLDYTPEDVAAFRGQVREHIVPLAAELYEQQRREIGVGKLYFYDENFTSPAGAPRVRTDPAQIVASAAEMFRELSPECGEMFDFLRCHGLFDLETRPGKGPGGYCITLPSYGAPFIFSNFNGTADDIDTLTHESGHALEYYLAGKNGLLPAYREPTNDIAEVHSMAMEYLTLPYMERFFGEDADRYRAAKLREAVKCIPYLTAVDEFQARVYERLDKNGKCPADERRSIWQDIESVYLPWRDYGDSEFLSGGGFWMQKEHIFLYPFYYVDYALAQMGALELMLRARHDRDAALNDYLALVRAGGSLPYRPLLALAGLSDPFSPGTVRDIAQKLRGLL